MSQTRDTAPAPQEPLCSACPQQAQSDQQLYGKRWCADCAASIRFEERLAKSRGLIIRDVVADTGKLHVCFATTDGHCPSAEMATRFGGLTVTRSEIIARVLGAIADLRRQLIQFGNRFVIGSEAAAAATRFLNVAAWGLPMLEEAERAEFEPALEFARRILQRTRLPN